MDPIPVALTLALLALLILPHLLELLALPKLLATARLTIMEMPKPALTLPPLLQCFDALRVLTTVSSLLKHQQLPLPLLIAPALPTSTVPIPSVLLPLALNALPILPHLLMCSPLPKLLAAAMLTFMEMLNPVLQQLLAAGMLLQPTAVLALSVVPLLLKQQQLPLPLLIAPALPTNTVPIPLPLALPALVTLPHLL
jgi:hypothetical protein